MSQDDWTVEQIGSEDTVEMRMRNGSDCNKFVQFENEDGEVVELRVDEEGLGRVVGDRDPVGWVDAAAHRIGIGVQW